MRVYIKPSSTGLFVDLATGEVKRPPDTGSGAPFGTGNFGTMPLGTTGLLPINVVATPGDGRATLTWEPPASEETFDGYLVGRDGADGGWETIDPLGTTSRTFWALTNGVEYELYVAVVQGESIGPMATATVTPVSPDPGGGTVPDPPTNVTATAQDGSILMEWTHTTSTITGYRVGRTGLDGGWQGIIAATATATTFYALNNGESYDVWIEADNNGEPSTRVTVSGVVPTASSTPPPSGGGALSIDRVVYGEHGVVYRDDGRLRENITLGAAPWGKHEAKPLHGKTSWDWYDGARWGANGPTWDEFMVPWGQLFADLNGAGTYDVRLHVKDVTFMVLNSSNVWEHVKPSAGPDIKPTGGYFKTDPGFGGSGTGDTPEWRSEGAGEGWSGTLKYMQGQPASGNALVHWFYGNDFYPRPAVPAGTKAVLSAAQMRLITDVSGDPSQARFIGSFGGDNWPVGTGGKPAGTQITAFFQPRMGYVTEEWNWFFGYTFGAWFNGDGSPNASAMGETQMRANPPPMVGSTIGTTWGDRS